MFDSKMLLVILAIALVIFGTKRLRTIGTDLGAAVKGFKQAMTDGESEERRNSSSRKRTPTSRLPRRERPRSRSLPRRTPDLACSISGSPRFCSPLPSLWWCSALSACEGGASSRQLDGPGAADGAPVDEQLEREVNAEELLRQHMKSPPLKPDQPSLLAPASSPTFPRQRRSPTRNPNHRSPSPHAYGFERHSVFRRRGRSSTGGASPLAGWPCHTAAAMHPPTPAPTADPHTVDQ